MRALAGLSLVLLASTALADTPKKPVPPPPPQRPVAPHKEGEYGGVKPGTTPDKPQKKPPKGTLSWIGFEAPNGGAQIFFQSVAPFEVTQTISNGVLTAHLSLTSLGHNTWRQVDTRFFDNPLAGIQARAVRSKKGSGIDVRITFKNPKDAHDGAVRTATEADGLYYVYLSWPEVTAPSSK